MGSASPSSKQVPLVSESSPPKQMQLLFTPLILASEPISVSNDSFALSMLPVGTLRKIGGFADVGTVRNLIATCKYIRNQLNTWFLQLLASKNNPDRTTSGFIIDAIENKGNTCLWCNAKFFIKDYAIPKEISIHLFANVIAEKISSDKVRSMIIQVSGLSSPSNPFYPSEPHHDIRKFLKFLFLKVSFKNLKCLMACGIQLSEKFSQEIGALKLDILHMRNFHYKIGEDRIECFDNWNSLKTLYVVHPDKGEKVYPPDNLKKLVIYCPKSSKNRRARLDIDVNRCHALKEM